MRTTLLDVARCPRSGRPLAVAQVVEADGEGSIVHGLLGAEGFTYPVIAGIPVLRPDVDELVELVERGLVREATAHAALGDVPRSRLLPFASAATELRGVGAIARRVEHELRARIRDADVRRLYGDPPAGDITTDPLQALFLGHRRPNEEGYRYFRYRFGTPRYLVALALLDALAPSRGPALDVGCGAGHLTWSLARRHETVVGVDPSFAQLLTAAALVPEADFICGDGRCLPLARQAFGVVVSSDVLPYVAEKRTAVHELTRVVGTDGALVMTALRNSGHEHVHPGEPLRPLAWKVLVEDLAEVALVGDDAVLDAYLAGRAPGDVDERTAVTSQTVSVVAAHQPFHLARTPWNRWPHEVGPLAPHPLLQPVGPQAGGILYERRFPSDTFAVDNRRIREYLPERCVIPAELATGGDGHDGDTEAVRALIGAVALLGMPPAGRDAPPAGGSVRL